jgi:N-carbamoyl-L-amino-acid hydrolase
MPRIDSRRLWERLMAMAEIGRRGETGVDRPAFSLEDRAARRLLYGWAREHGLDVTQDPIGNLFLRCSGSRPELAPVLTGSHLDSQPTGGRFDGVFGVLASLEVVATLVQAGVQPVRPIEVVAWSNEEGSRFAPGSMGSQIFAGVHSLAEVLQVQDSGGVRLGTAVADTLAALPEAPLRDFGPAPSAYLEAHIEQGPRLEREGVPVGVVTGIQGCLWLECEVRGVAAHAGTTPQDCRCDAFEGAVRVIETLRTRCLTRSADCRFTVGRVKVEPNTPNTIPGRVTFTIDFRHSDPLVFGELSRELLTTRASPPFELDVRELFQHPPQMFPSAMTRVVADAVRSLGCPDFQLVSGAFHDALFLCGKCPTGMIFVRCRGGVSHNALEFAEPADLATGAQVLLQALLRLASE